MVDALAGALFNARPCPGNRTPVGNRAGWKDEANGLVNGIPWKNITLRFSISKGREVNDVSIWFATPTKDWSKNLPAFQKFVSQIKFKGSPANCSLP